MEELIKSIVYLLVGVSVLLVGMRLMSGGLKKLSGKGVKNFFKKAQTNPLLSLGIGTSVTAIIQSSDATNAMVIGFINAGVMTIYQGLSIMLGAYIGTTATGVIASFSSLSISVYFLLFAFIGIALTFFKSDKVKYVGEILAGLGLLFFGLVVMKDAFKNPDITNACTNLLSTINFGPLLFVIGFILAVIFQSSSAVTSIVIAMVGASAIGLSDGLYVALGASLGTVTNTLLSSIDGNINGKRAAIAIFLLRILSSAAMLIILLIFETPLIKFFKIFEINGTDELPVAMFTVFYNAVFMPALIPLLKPAIKLTEKIVKDKDTDELSKSIRFIDDKLLNTPEIAAMMVKKEIINMYDLAKKNYNYSMDLLVNGNKEHTDEIIKLEDQVDFLNCKITDYLINLSSKCQPETEREVGAYFHVINDIERIGDHAYNFYEMYSEMQSKDLMFTDKAKDEVLKFHEVLTRMFDIAEEVFNNSSKLHLVELHVLENQTDEYKTIYAENHYNRIKNNECIMELSPYYSSLLTELERIADHLNNIGYSISNPIGDDK